MNIFEILTLRSEYMELVLNMRVPGEYKEGTLEGLTWFLDEGVSKNKRFKGTKRAAEIAKTILDAV